MEEPDAPDVIQSLIRRRHTGSTMDKYKRLRLRLRIMRTAAMFAVTVAVIIAAFGAARAQDQALPRFEVASVRHNTSGELIDSLRFQPGGRFVATNVRLQDLIFFAYDIPRSLQPYLLVGGTTRRPMYPCLRNCASKDDVLSARFDIQAIAPPPPTDQTAAEVMIRSETTTQPDPMIRLMIRTLLMDRFNMKVHTETREIPVYAVTVARAGRLGPDLRPSPYNCAAFRAGLREGRLQRSDEPSDDSGRPACTQLSEVSSDSVRRGGTTTIDEMLTAVAGFVDRPLVNHAGLTGEYVWELTRQLPGPGDVSVPAMTTVFRDQLGLRLQPETSPYEVIVLESIEMPTPN